MSVMREFQPRRGTLDDDVLPLSGAPGPNIHRVRAQLAQAVGELRIVERDHAALAGRDDLARMKREARQRAYRADRPAPIDRADRTGGVLDDLDPMTLPELEEAIDVGRKPDLMDGHDDLRALGDRTLAARDRGCRSAIDVREDRRCAQCQTEFAVAMKDSDGT